MSSFGSMQNDLALLGMASLLNADFGALLNKCQLEEVEAYEWSFLFTNIVINSIVPLSSGTVTLTQGSATAVGSGLSGTQFRSASAGWWLRAGATQTAPVLVNSVNTALNTTDTLTLSVPWGAPSVSAASYSLFPRFYSVAPLIEVYDVKQVAYLSESSQSELNYFDPTRVSTGGNPSIRWAPGQFDSSGNFQIELWPIPSNALPYIVEGKTGFTPMVNSTDLPQVPSAVLEAKAMMYACRAVYASSGNPKWLSLAQTYQQDYAKELDDAKTADKKRAVTRGISASRYRLLGADVIVTHDYFGENTP